MMLRRLALAHRTVHLNKLVPRRNLSTAPHAEPVEAATALAGPETYSKALSLFHWLVGLSMMGSVGAVCLCQLLFSIACFNLPALYPLVTSSAKLVIPPFHPAAR